MKQKYKIIWWLILSLGFFWSTFAAVYTSENTSVWLGYSNTCSSAENNHISVTPSTLPSTWNGNTIYDFQAGTYNLSSTITIDQPCTALVGTDGVIINGNGSTVISISSPFIIIQNLQIFGNNADWIMISNTNSNTLSNNTIYWSNRWIYLTTTSNNIIKNSQVFWNTIGLYILNNSNNNLLNNIISFNNIQHWIYINTSNLNSVNNSISFNNNQFWFLVRPWTQNIFNNSYSYNNNANGIRLPAWNYTNKIWLLNNLWNTLLASSTWYGLIKADVALPVGLALWSSTDPILWAIWWTDWSVDSSLVVDQSQILNPFDGTNYLVDISTGTTNWKWTKTFGTILDLTNSQWWSNLPTQSQPVQWDTGWTTLINSSILFSSSKKIGQKPTVSWWGGGWWSTNEPTSICGNTIVEYGEECDDGNTWNGDWCTTTCQTEEPGTCGNAILEYMEQCDDGNLHDGDWCSSSCSIESSTEIYDKKYFSTQKDQFSEITSIKELINAGKIETANGIKITTSGWNILSWITPAEIILLWVEQNEDLTPSLECQYTNTNYKNIHFTDIDWPYKQDIETLMNYCIIQWKWKDINNLTFAPKQAATYAEFIKVLVKTHFLGRQINFQSPSLPIQTIYPLVDMHTWYAPYITKAYIYDLLLPLDKNINHQSLSPNVNISKLDAITLLINSLEIAGKNPKNIEIITDTFTNAHTPLTREEMAGLIVKWYQLDYEISKKIRSNNKMIIKLLSESIKKYNQQEQIDILQKAVIAIGKLQEKYLQKYNIYKKELLEDLENILNLYNSP